jgi:hypothetical protein
MADFNDFSLQKIRSGGGRRQPKSSEYRDAAAERIIKLIEKGKEGCRLTATFPELNSKDMKRIEEHNNFATADNETKLEILNERLVDLYDKKISNRNDRKVVEKIDRQVIWLLKQIDDLLMHGQGDF